MILAALALLAAPCGIDRVIPRKDGVAISFTYSRTAFVQRSEAPNRNVRIGSRPVQLRPGETLNILNHHDGCTMEIGIKDGQIGVWTHAWWTHLAPDMLEETSFVPAQRR